MSRVIQAWKQFHVSNAEDAAKIEGLVLESCSLMSEAKRGKRAEVLSKWSKYDELEGLINTHSTALGLEKKNPREIALWVNIICFNAITSSQKKE